MTTTADYPDPVGRAFIDVPLTLPDTPEGAGLDVVEAHWRLALSITRTPPEARHG